MRNCRSIRDLAFWCPEVKVQPTPSHGGWQGIRRGVVTAFSLFLSACGTPFNDVYSSSFHEHQDVEGCGTPPPTMLRREEILQFYHDRRPACLAGLLRRRIEKELPPGATHWLLRLWLNLQGFDCTAIEDPSGPGHECRMRRTSHYFVLIFPGDGPPQEHIWQVTSLDVTPVMPSVRVKVWYPEAKDEIKRPTILGGSSRGRNAWQVQVRTTIWH